jgi:hypothetical protein
VYNFAATCCKKQQKQFLTILILEIKKASLAKEVQLKCLTRHFFCAKITGFLGLWK